MKILVSILLLALVTACSPMHSRLGQLGEESNFSDLEIPDDFDEQEDSTEPPTQVEIPIEAPPVFNLKNTFSVSSNAFQLAHGVALRWDGCVKDKATQGGYNSDTKCGRAFFHPSFADNLNYAFFICVFDAAKQAGYPEPKKVFIKHIGSYNDRNARNSSRLSNHAYARAWDIVNFNMFDESGKLHRVSTYLRDYKGQQAKFYDEFRDCWQESLPSSCVSGKSEFRGSIGHRASKLGGNTLHNDHLHLSYPLCAGNS